MLRLHSQKVTQIRAERKHIKKYRKQEKEIEQQIKEHEQQIRLLEQQCNQMSRDSQALKKKIDKDDMYNKTISPLLLKKVQLTNAKKTLDEQLKEIQEKIRDTLSNDKEYDYLCAAAKHLNEYCKIKADFAAIQQLYEQGDISKVELEMKRRLYLNDKNRLFQEFEAEFFPERQIDSTKKCIANLNSSLTGCNCNVGYLVTQNGMGFMCKRCKAEQVHYIQSTTSNCSYDTLKNMNRSREYTYRRITHFRDLLRHVQGKSKSSAPKNVEEALRSEFRRCRIEPTMITIKLIRRKLKKLELSDYYEHATAFAQLLNPNFKTLDISPAREELLCYLFCQTEVPFEKIKRLIKKTRKNYMSYPFVAYKLCELKGWNEYLPHFQLLKSQKLLQDQDSYWYLVTQLIGWPFYNTIGNVSRNMSMRKNEEFAEIHNEIQLIKEKREKFQQVTGKKRTLQMVEFDNNEIFEEDDEPLHEPPDNNRLGYRINEEYLD